MTQCLIRKLFSGVWNVSASHLTTDYYATIAGIKLKWYDCFARNRSIDLVRHSSENKQTTEHRRKRRITLRTSTFTHRTANENNCLKWIWTHAHTKCYSDPENYKSMLIQSSLSLSLTLRLIFTGKNPNYFVKLAWTYWKAPTICTLNESIIHLIFAFLRRGKISRGSDTVLPSFMLFITVIKADKQSKIHKLKLRFKQKEQNVDLGNCNNEKLMSATPNNHRSLRSNLICLYLKC